MKEWIKILDDHGGVRFVNLRQARFVYDAKPGHCVLAFDELQELTVDGDGASLILKTLGEQSIQ
jgi:hypothetical protein